MNKTTLPGSSGLSAFRKAAWLQILVVQLLTPGLVIWTSPVRANPQGGNIVHGNVNIGSGAGGNLQIRQNSQQAIIDWASFSIGAGELTQFRQPNSNAAVLNRVTGGDPSAIHGALRANGNVFVINPNGILVGPGGTIDVHGLVLSTLDVSNGEFLAGGDLNFKGAGGAGVTNLGRINAIGGDVFLIGRTVTNSGSIRSEGGRVGLAAGEEVLLTAGEGVNGERMFVRAKGSGVSGTGIFNDGTIEGAAVELKAHGNLYALAINNKGSIRATGAVNSGGQVYLRGTGGSVNNSGSIRATSSGVGNAGRVLIDAAYAKVDGIIAAQGGNVRITGTDSVSVGGNIDVSNSGGKGGGVIVEGADIRMEEGSLVDASGSTGGGNALIGGSFQGRDASILNADTLTVAENAVVRADATESGRGGVVILWSDGDTLFNGEVTARGFSSGGFAEISGKGNLGFDGDVDLTAVGGSAGTLLLDPTNVTIGTAVASPTHINNIALSNALDQGNNVIISTNFGAAGQRGDITVQAGTATTIGQNLGGIEWYQQNAGTVGGTLTFLATGNILFANDVRSAGAGGINIVAGWDGFTGLIAPIDPLNGTQAQLVGGFDMSAVLATLNDGNAGNDAAGLNSGSVFISGYDINGVVSNTVTEAIEVGSRYGDTRVAAHDLLIRGSSGSQRWAQLGFRDSGNEFGLNGTIAIGTQTGERNEWWGSNGAADGSGGATSWGNIQNKDYIALLGGTFEKGGAFRGAGFGATGDIEIGLSGRLDLRGGNGGNAYGQIGHGGTGAEGVEIARNAQGIGAASVTTRDGTVMDVADNNRTYFGATWRQNYLPAGSAIVDGNITITSAEDILVMSPSDFENAVGYTDLSNNDGNGNRYVRIGHGGLDNFGSYHGDISVIALGALNGTEGRGLAGSGIQIRGGMGSLSPAQIGHGGFHEGNRRTIFDQTSSGNITVRAETGAVRALGYNLLPRIGDQVTGTYAGVDTILPSGSNNDTEYEFSNVQIGHGGWHRDRVTTGGTFTAPTGFTATAVIPDQSMTGDIEVYAGGTVQVRDVMGYDSAGNWTPDPGPGVDPILLSGGILRDVGIEVRAGNAGWSFGQIGHGGVNMNSNATGSIQGDVTATAAAGTILFVGGEEKRSQRDWGIGGSFVQLGHGGYDTDAMNATNGFAGAINVSAGKGGNNGLGQAITPVDGDIIFRTSRYGEGWAQVGHGGRSSNGDLIVAGNRDAVAPISVIARDAVEFTGRISGPTNPQLLSTDYININILDTDFNDLNNYAGANGNLIDEDTRPQAAARGYGHNVDIKHVQIGHGGYDFLVNDLANTDFSLNNSLTVRAENGSLRFTSGNANNDYAQIGMGGIDFGQDRNITNSDILVEAAGDIWFDSSASGSLENNRIPLATGTGFETRGFSVGVRGFAMIGNGGYDIDGDFTGDVTVDAGGNLHMIGPDDAGRTVTSVTGYVGGSIEGPLASNGNRMPLTGNAHATTALQEATMKARSFFLYHGTGGAAPAAFQGAIVPGTVRIDTQVDPDLGDYNNDGNLRRTAGGPILGTVDYATGKVTIFERVQTDDNAINRNVDYSYTLPSTVVQNIQDERTPESDSALFATQAYLGHGGIVPGTVSLVIDENNDGGGRQVFSDWFGNGVLYNSNHLRVGQIDYTTGRIIIEGINVATGDGNADGEWELGTSIELRAPLNSRTNPDEVTASYQYSNRNSDQSFVQIGNGGYATGIGGRNTAGASGEIRVTAGGDVRLHGGYFDDNSVQIGHGGRGNQSRHGYQADQVDRANPDFGAIDADGSGNITVQAGGILEMLAGRGVSYWDNESYVQLGHGGYDADGHHQGNIRVTAGTGAISLKPGVLGGSGSQGGVVFTAGQARDAYAQLGHGGFGARSSREDNDSGARGFTGNISVLSGGDVLFTAGTSLWNYQDYDDGRLYSQLGHGGYDADIRHDGGTQLRNTGIGHAGDITVTSSAGSVRFMAGDQDRAVPGGQTLGNGNGILGYSHLGHGGYSAQGDHHGDITVTAAEDVSFLAGNRTQDDSTDKRNYVLLGHGGDESEGYNGARDVNGNPLDEIRVTATNGNIDFIAGTGRRNWAQLGNGGFSNNGDSVANIFVSAGGDVNFIGGQGEVASINDGSRSLDVASWTGGTGAGGWTQLRYRDIRVNIVNFTITVAGSNYIATGATVQEADSDGAFTSANLVAQANVDLNGDTIVDIPVGTVVGEINMRTGSVRFFRDLDPNGTGQVTAAYNTAGGSSGAVNVSTGTENSTTNPMLAVAVRGPGNFSASSPSLQATFNNTRGGIGDISEGGGSTFPENIGIASGTFRIVVPDGTVVEDNGSGSLLVTTAAPGSGLTVGASVGTINYDRGQVMLEQVINPKGIQGVRAYYDTDRTIAADYSYAQLGNGGYEASDITTNTDKSSVGNLSLIAGGDVRFHAGNGLRAYTQMGNGGYNNKGAHSGNITLTAGGAIEFLAGVGADETDQQAYAQLGHGGYEGDGNHFGNITISGGTGFASSRPGYAYLGDSGTQIGLLFKAGDRADSYTQLGHGGRSARTGTATVPYGLNGDIGIISGGSVSFVAGTGTLDPEGDIFAGEDFRLYAQLGHGGYDADAADSGDTMIFFNQRGGTGISGTEGAGDGHWGHFGDIEVNAGGGINLLGADNTRSDAILRSAGAGAGTISFVQAGHGGYHSSGDHYGSIALRAGVTVGGGGPVVTNPNADLVVQASNQQQSEWADTRAYAQIGHGGLNASAAELGRTGDIITVMAGRDVLVGGGTGVGNYAQIGNGGTFLDRNTALTASPVGFVTARGDIDIFAGRDVKVTGAGFGDLAAMGKGIENTYAYVSATDDTRSIDRAANLNGGGDFTMQYNRVLNGTITLEIRRDDGEKVGELAQSGNNIVVVSDFTQDMNGNGTIEPSEIFTAGQVVGTYNPATRSVAFNTDLNPGADDGVANLLVSFEHVNIDRGYAQIGHGGYDADFTTVGTTNQPITDRGIGDISILAGGDLMVKGGDGFANYAQVGHGGYSTPGIRQGDITIGTAMSRNGGAVIVEGGRSPLYEAVDAYAQIGHGGRSATGTSTGNIEIYAGTARDAAYAGTGALVRAGDRQNNFALIGHGGTSSRSGSGNDAAGMQGNSGNVTVDVTGNINVIAGVLNRGGSNVAQSVDDGNLYAQIGHGGYDVDVSLNGTIANGNGIGHNGDIKIVSSLGSVNVLGGDHARAFMPSVAPVTGAYEPYLQSNLFRNDAIAGGRFHYALIGHGGYEARGNHFGDITVHAGYDGSANLTGTAANSSVNVIGGRALADQDDSQQYAQIGHGGRSGVGDQGRVDEVISVLSAGDVSVKGGVGTDTYAQIGSGGTNARGDHKGDIQILAGGSVSALAGDFPRNATLGNGIFSRYYHVSVTNTNELNQNLDRAGLLQSVANNFGGVTAVGQPAGQVLFRAVNGVIGGSVELEIFNDSGVRIGTIEDDGTGALRVVSDFTELVGGSQLVAGQQVGSVNYAANTLTFTTRVNPGAEGGAANVIVNLEHVRTERAYAQIGHGGYDSDNPDGNTALGATGNIRIAALGGDVIGKGGASSESYSLMGHGGRSTSGANSGNISVRAAGNVGFSGGSLNRTFAQLGHGGYDSDGNHVGDIIVSAGSGNLFTSLSNTKGAAGGWYNDLGDFNGDLIADELLFAPLAGSVSLTGGTGGDGAYVAVGHGGYITSGNFSGDIGVSSYGDIGVVAGNASRASAQIGHGGNNADTVMNLTGDVHVISETGDLLVKAGTGTESYALIGHGDDQDTNTANAQGNRQGRVHVIADHITLDRNGNRVAWIGHTFDMAANNDDPFADQTLQTPGDNLGGGYEVIGRSGLTYNNAGALQNGGTITVTDSFRDRIITPNLKDANFAMSGGNIVINSVIDSTTSYAVPATLGNSVTFLAAGDIDVNRRIQAPGTGSVNLIAGAGLAGASIVDDPSRTGGVSGTNLNFQSIDHLWHVPTGYIDMAQVRTDGLQWGNANGFAISSGEFANAAGEISMDAINNGANANLAIGSKAGESNALGYRVRLIGGDSAGEYAQFGYFTDAVGDPATGNVFVHAKNGGVEVRGGTGGTAGTSPNVVGTFAQIGHGGTAPANAAGNVKNLSGSIAVRADYGSAVGDVSVLGGGNSGAAAQIGHGGRYNDGNHSGQILVIGEGLAVTAGGGSAQIGHGGFQTTGSFSGDLFINHDPFANGGMGAAVGGGGALSITAAGSFDQFAQIGHGGVVSSGGSRNGNIIVGQSAGVTLQGGTSKSTSAQLGHGGVGSGSGAFSGNIDLNTTGNVSVVAGASSTGNGSAFAMIGHGGTGASGTKSGDITIDALGTLINVAGPNTAVVSNSNFAQIGHGGDASGNTLTGNIEINAPNAALSLTAGNQARAFAKVGHGGYDSDGAQSGTIDLTLGGAVSLTGGGDHSIAQIGHGSSLGTGTRDGAISLVSSSGNLSLISGAGLNASTQIGHGGVGATGNIGTSVVNGGILVDIAGDLLMNAGSGTDAYTQIGQGGTGAAGIHQGDICVHIGGDFTLNSGTQGNGTRAYGQIGHGGYAAVGDKNGKVTVVTGLVSTGGIAMNGGAGADQYVQIGHGGTSAGGNMSGRVFAVADNGGDLVMNGGSGSGTYAMISHGDGYGDYGNIDSGTTNGTREGGIQYFVDGDAILNSGSGADSNVHLLHRTNDSSGLDNVNYLGGDGYQYVVNGTSTGTAAADARENENTIIAGNFGVGNIVITATGDLTLDVPLNPAAQFANHSFSFIVLATGDLNFNRSFQNAGTGLVALVAGWDGVQDLSTINYNNGVCNPEIIPGSINFNDCDRFGQNQGVLTIGNANQTEAFAVGSRQGQTILRGYEINVIGSNTTAGASTQIGFRADGSGDITGTIDVHAKEGGLHLIGGAADGAFVQIGHGSGSGTFANNVTSAATINVSFCDPADVSVTGGAGLNSFAQIGNGGGTGNYARNGAVTLSDVINLSLTGGTGTGAYSQIGSGGTGGSGAISGAVMANVAGAVNVTGGGTDAYARIGAGGIGHNGAITNASVNVSGTSVTLNGGAASRAYAQIGAGGSGMTGAITGDVTVASTSGAINLGALGSAADGNYAQIGAGGGGVTGITNTVNSKTTVSTVAGGLNMNSTNAAFTQIGAGGLSYDGALTGDVQVTVDGTLSMTGGTANHRYAQIGNGGSGADGTKTGNTTVSSSSLSMTSGTGAGASTHIGLGGGMVQGVNDFASGTLNGNVMVTTINDGVTLNAATAGVQAYTQIGNGGLAADGNSTGTSTVQSAGAVALTAGAASNTYARIGAGGAGIDGNLTNTGVTVTGTNLTMTSGTSTSAYTQIGAGGGLTGGGNLFTGNITGDTSVTMSGTISMTSGTGGSAFSQIGAGGAGVNGNAAGNSINSATTVSGTSVAMSVRGGNGAYTQIGAGGGATGFNAAAPLSAIAPVLGSITGNVSVTATNGGVSMSGQASGTRNYLQIGAGGSGVQGGVAAIGAGNTVTSNTLVSTTGGGLTMDSTLAASAQIGAGGLNADASYNGSVTADIDGAISLTGGVGVRRYAMIGLGGADSDGTKAGAINVSGTSLTAIGSSGDRAFVQIGHGGSDASGNVSNSNITLDIVNGIQLQAGAGQAYAQIGHGGYQVINSTVTNSGIFINQAAGMGLGDLRVLGGTGNNAHAMIGHGGSRADGSIGSGSVAATGDVIVDKAANVVLSGGSVTDSYAQIGHGGESSIGPFSGIVTVNSAGTISLTGGASNDSYAQIGHGGDESRGATSGNVSVNAGGALTLQGASGALTDGYAQIGHGGHNNDAAHGVGGNRIAVSAASLSLLGGTGARNYAQIGMGGNDSDGNHTGNIVLSIAGGPVQISAGSADEAYAQIGNGGHIATGNFAGDISLNFDLLTQQITGTAGALTMTGGSAASNNAYAQIGHGGTGANVDINAKTGNIVLAGLTGATISGGTSTAADNFAQVGHGGDENDGAASGAVALLTTGLVTLNGGTGSDSYVQVGHGGHEATGNLGLAGDFVSVVGTGLDLNGSAGQRAYVQVGFGGFNADGVMNSSVFVNVNPLDGTPVGGGAITMDGGSGADSYIQIGAGGSGADGNKIGNTTVYGDSVSVVAGVGGSSYAQIGAGSGIHADTVDRGSGDISSNTTVTATNGGVTVSAASAGAHAYAQIGAGGLVSTGNLSGNNAISTTVNATGAIALTGGGNSNNYAMIGLGGAGSAGTKSLAGTSVTGASITLTGGTGPSAYTQIGSGGGMTGGNAAASGAISGGDTTVTSTGGAIILNSGGGTNAYSRIGAGGTALAGLITGNTVVDSAGDVTLNSASGGVAANTQIGLGGFNADGVQTGSTTVTAAGAVALTGGAANESYAMIGSGGAGSDNNKDDADVLVRGTEVSVTAGAGTAAFAQIGSGGGATATTAPTGNVDGAVSVVSTSGNVSVNGGGSRAYAQIGNGGGQRNGDFSGAIQLVSAGDLSINGGTASDAYGLVGHGGLSGGGFTTGARQGDVLVRVQGATSLTDASSISFIGHRGSAGVSGSSRLALVSGQLDLSNNATGLAGIIGNTIGAGSVEIGLTNDDLLLDTALSYNSAFELDLFASGGITVESSLQNAGTGNVSLVAGWDGTTGLVETISNTANPPITALSLDTVAVGADANAFGNNGAGVAVGNAAAAVAVGSRAGSTTVLGDSVTLTAGTGGADQYAQIGYRGTNTNPISGAIVIGTKAGGLSLVSSSESGGFTQIGHGGMGSSNAGINGDIVLNSLVPGDLNVTAGAGSNSYSQIGHGGTNFSGTMAGNIAGQGEFAAINVTGGSGLSTYAQIGHGGDSAIGAKTGAITLTAQEATVMGGSQFRSNAQIGHGGRSGFGNLGGAITIETTTGDLTVQAGSGLLTSAQIGHGGSSYAGFAPDEAITITTATDLVVQGGLGNQAFAQIGHGGNGASGSGFGGDLALTVGEALRVTGGSGLTSYAQIGNGGAYVSNDQSGDISVVTGTSATLRAPGAGSGAYAKIGHGDDLRDSFAAVSGSGNRTGDITVAAGTDLTLQNAMIGHAGSTSNATGSGTTFIGASWNNPANPNGGDLVVNAASELAGDELRFYLPRRANNQIAVGAMLNGISYGGGKTDPQETQGADERTIYIETDNGIVRVDQHDSTFGSGDAPTNAGSFAFYFDTIVQGTPPEPPLPPEPPTPPVPPGPDYPSFVPDDSVYDDMRRDEEERFSGPGSTSIFYEGFQQYGPDGEPIFNFNSAQVD